MQEGVESIGEFVISRGEAAELFETIEESLDEISRLVAMPVDFAWRISVAARWDDGLSTGSLNDLNQGGALGDVGHLASGQDQPNGITQRIDTGMDLGGQPAPRAADRLIATVFLGAPAACWCARTMVASMNSSSRSASP